jgi:hypothetical protein
LAGHCEARGLRQPAFATDVPVEKITDEQARNVLGSVSGRKRRRSAQENAPNLTFRNKTAQAVTSLAHADPTHGIDLQAD